MRNHIWLIATAFVALAGGCSTVRVTNPPRTATEQFLLSEAAIDAVELLSFDALHGRKVFLDETHFAPAEKEFVLAEFRAKLLHGGVQLMPSRGDAEIVVEVRSGGVGIDRYESLVGVPSIVTPGTLAAAAGDTPMATLITPEIAITKNMKQLGFASVAYVAYWTDTGEIVASSGPAVGRTYREDWWLLGFGPRSIGTIPPVDHDLE